VSSRFDPALDLFIETATKQGEGRRRQKKRQWSTSSVQSYNELLEKLTGEEQNTDFLKLYSKDKSSDGAASASIQAALRAQIQFLAVARRAFRMKMMVGPEAREFSSLDHDRYAYNDGAITISKIRSLKNSPAINPSDSAVSGSTEE
jgi:hypothetical protein